MLMHGIDSRGPECGRTGIALLAATLIGMSMLAPGAVRAWQARVDPGTDGRPFFDIPALAVDAAGDIVVVAGIARAVGLFAVPLRFETVAVKLSPYGNELWRVILPDVGAYSVVVDPAGDVILGGVLLEGESVLDALALKLDGQSGIEKWRNRGAGFTVGVDVNGDVFGVTHDLAPIPGAMWKLSGATGAPLWSASMPSSVDLLGFASASEIVAAGRDDPDAWHGSILRAFSTATGTQLWERFLSQEQYLRAIRGNGAGGLITLSTKFTGTGSLKAIQVHNLSAGSGEDLWQSELWRDTGSCNEGGIGECGRGGIGLDGNGDVLIGHEFRRDPCERACNTLVTKLARSTGQEIWRVESGFGLRSLAVDPSGDMVLVGPLGSGQMEGTAVAKVAGASGAVLWQKAIASTSGRPAFLWAVAATDQADVVTTGTEYGRDVDLGSDKLFTTKLSGLTGEDIPTNCGNGTLDFLEQCDDGNTADVDICPSASANGCQYTATSTLIRGSARRPDRDRAGCQVEWYVLNPNNPTDKHRLPNQVQVCTDADPSCDFNADAGWCGFQLVVCANNRDPNLHACLPDGVDEVAVISPRSESGRTAQQRSTRAAGRAAVEHAVTHLLDPKVPTDGFVKAAPIAAQEQNLCSAPFRFDVPADSSGLKVKTRSAGRRDTRILKQRSQLKLICRATQ